VLAADRPALTGIKGLGDAAVTLLKLTSHLTTMHDAAIRRQIAAVPLAEPPSLRGSRPDLIGDSAGTNPPVAPAVAGRKDDLTVIPVDHATGGETAPEAGVPISAPPAPTAVDRRGAQRTTPKPRQPRPDPDVAPTSRWRATGRYSASNMLKPGMVAEMQVALTAYARLRDRAATRRYLLDGGLPQRSRASRRTIVTTVTERLASWNPPNWVCSDLIETSTAGDLTNLKLLLLLHTARQDTLLYAIVQEVIVPRWREGVAAISHIEMQRYLDDAAPTHPEITTWSRATRIKLAGNLLTVLRDYGLLVGAASKRIVEPVVSPFAAGHLARLLQEEGIESAAIADHPDWAIWLLAPDRVRALLSAGRREGSAQ
jgi:hypothetical protein